MYLDPHELQNIRPSEGLYNESGQNKKEKSDTAFAGHILYTLMEQLFPEKMSMGDPNTRLYFGLYLEEIFNDPKVVEGFGFQQILEKESQKSKTSSSPYQLFHNEAEQRKEISYA